MCYFTQNLIFLLIIISCSPEEVGYEIVPSRFYNKAELYIFLNILINYQFQVIVELINIILTSVTCDNLLVDSQSYVNICNINTKICEN